MKKVAIAAISLISIFHIDKLPALMSVSGGLLPDGTSVPAGTFIEKKAAMDTIKDGMPNADLLTVITVAIWAVDNFAEFHPDVVVKMGLVAAD